MAILDAEAALDGVGTLGAAGITIREANGILAGVGTLGATGATVREASSTFAGLGALGASMVIDRDTYRTMVLNAGPIAYWRLDTTTALDTSGSGLHGTNAATTNGAGALRNSGNQATYFNGSASINLGNPAALQRTTPFTIEMFFKSPFTNASGLYSGHPLAGSYPPANAGGAGVYIALVSNGINGNVVAGLWSGVDGVWKTITSTNAVTDGKWHYLAFSWDGGTTLQLHIDDGPTQSIIYGGGAFTPTYSPTATFWIGRLSSGFNMVSGSAIDEVAVYPRLLTGIEMADHSARRLYQSGWSYGRPLNVTRYQFAAADVGTNMHVMGGYNSGARFEHEAYDPALRMWTNKAGAPFGSYGGFATYMNGYIYYGGGTAGSNWYRYNVSTNSWAFMPSLPSSTSEGAVVGVASQDKVYYFPNSGALGCIFNAATLTWTSNAFSNVVPFGRAALHTNGKIYLHKFQLLYEFDPVTLVTTQKASSPGSFQYHGWVSWLGKLWAVAGLNGGSSYQAVMNSYDPVANTWAVETSMLATAGYVRAGVVGGAIMVPGGYNGAHILTTQLYTPAATSGSSALTVTPNLSPYPLGAVNLEVTPDLQSAGEKIDGTKGLEVGPIRVAPRLPGPVALASAGRMWPWSSMKGTLGPIWDRVTGSEVPLPAADASNIYVGTGDQTEGPTGIDEYAYATTDGGRYFYLACGYWWSPSWDQWWSNRLYRWDMQDEVWTELAVLPGYVGSEGCTGGIIDGKFYVLMGDTGSTSVEPFGVGGVAPDPEWLPDDWYLQSMWVYDIAANTWTRGTQPPHAQDYGCSTVFGGKLYHTVGYDEVNRSKWFQVYDPVADTWTQLADLPWWPYGTNSNMWVGDGKIWVQGTFVSTISGSPGVIKIFSYDVGTNVWTDETALFANVPVITGGSLYASAVLPISSTVVWLVGGQGSAGYTTYEVDVVAKTFTEINITLPDGWGWFGGGVYGTKKYVVMGDGTAVYTTEAT